MTAAHNEEAFIEGTIRSVLSQTIMPRRWVIVSDNSTDHTDEIVQKHARKSEFIHFLRITRKPGHSFGAKVRALHRGCELLEGTSYDYIGNLDADISLEPSYFERLIQHLCQNPRLGIVGGFVYEDSGQGYRSRRINRIHDVGHAAQMIRRECYEEIGGYAVLKYGGEDWCAQTKAKMLGWQIEAFPQLKIFHHRHTGGTSSPISNAFRLGRLDYSFGSDPTFEFVKCLGGVGERPYLLGALARMAGFILPHFAGEERGVPTEVVSFLRWEQRDRLWSALNPLRPVRTMRSARPKSILE